MAVNPSHKPEERTFRDATQGKFAVNHTVHSREDTGVLVVSSADSTYADKLWAVEEVSTR